MWIEQQKLARNALMVTVLAAGCGLDGTTQEPYCYTEPSTAFAPRPRDEAPVWDASLERPIDGVMTRLVLPSAFSRSAYYSIEEGDDAPFRMHFLVGQTTRASNAVRVACFVEGRAIDLGLESPLGPSTVVLSEGISVVEISVPPDVLEPGLNQVNVFATYEIDAKPVTFQLDAFTIANGSLAPQTYEDTPLAVSPPNVPSTFTDPSNGRLTPIDSSFGTRVSHLRGNLDVVVRVGPAAPDVECAGGFDRFAVVALRDGLPTPIAPFDRIVLTLNAGERRAFEHRIPLWSDTAHHQYFVWTLPGLGRAARRDDGVRSAAFDFGLPVNLLWSGSM